MRAIIAGTGSYLPKRRLANTEIEAMVETSDEWIRQRVGIASRPIASGNETTAYMATEAAINAMESAKVEASDIDLVIVATATADFVFPNCANEVVNNLTINNNCPAFDINVACAGFIYAMSIADKFIKTKAAKNALVIASERMSRTVSWKDRGTCVVFGDGAGAVVLSAYDKEDRGILSTHIHADGEGRELLFAPNPLPKKEFTEEVDLCQLYMEGNRVFKKAANKLGEVIEEALEANGLSKDEVDWMVPHQANLRIIQTTAKKFNLPWEKVVLTLEHHGNTSAASIPMAMDTAVRDGRIKPGQLLVLEAFGAGFTWGSAILRF